MYKVSRNILLPLLLLNITMSANNWSVFGVSIGQILLWSTLLLALPIVWKTPYRYSGPVLFVLFLIFGMGQIVLHSTLFQALKVSSAALIFIMAGAKIYGNEPEFLHKQLIVFLGLSIPIMLLQMSGASSFFMYWNTEYAHDLAILDPSEYGKFVKIPVYPTLFVGSDELYYQLGQGRPCGLLYSNNVLSVFVAITATINFGLSPNSKIRSSHAVAIAAVTLTMSLMSLAIAVLLYVGFLFFGKAFRKRLAVKLLLLLTCFLGMYYFFFPGLFVGCLSQGKLLGSLITRGLDLANSIGLSALSNLLSAQKATMGETFVFDEDASYSLFSQIFKSEVAIPLVTALVISIFIYFRKIRSFRRTTHKQTLVYIILLVVCGVTQLAVNFIAAPSYQLILGLAFFPLFKKLWMRDEPAIGEDLV